LSAAFDARHPMFRHVCDVEVMARTLDDPEVRSALAERCRVADARDEPITVVVCHDGRDALNVSLALQLVEALPPGRTPPVLVYLARTSGLAELLGEAPDPATGARHRPWRLDPRLRAFGMLEQVWTLETLIDEAQDRIARALHEEYCDSLERR